LGTTYNAIKVARWRQYEAIFPALATSRIDQVSVECAGAKVPLNLLGLLNGKEVLLGAEPQRR
jgi:5-methyltetrahydropteroyltriglutamate--homocysteine methyltransferase